MIFTVETLIFTMETLIFTVETMIFTVETGILTVETGILTVETLLFQSFFISLEVHDTGNILLPGGVLLTIHTSSVTLSILFNLQMDCFNLCLCSKTSNPPTGSSPNHVQKLIHLMKRTQSKFQRYTSRHAKTAQLPAKIRLPGGVRPKIQHHQMAPPSPTPKHRQHVRPFKAPFFRKSQR